MARKSKIAEARNALNYTNSVALELEATGCFGVSCRAHLNDYDQLGVNSGTLFVDAPSPEDDTLNLEIHEHLNTDDDALSLMQPQHVSDQASSSIGHSGADILSTSSSLVSKGTWRR